MKRKEKSVTGDNEMKNLRRVLLLLLLCFSIAQAVPVSGIGPIAAKAAQKEGLKKEKGKYYFYKKGKKVKKKMGDRCQGNDRVPILF